MKTIVYYTSNQEDPKFEKKIVGTLVKNAAGLPIISVSQKPMDLGKNICVGEVGLSYLNEWRQILIGARAAKTKYIVFAESDFLYPKEYFSFEPAYECVYRCSNVWIVYKDRDFFYRKKYSEGAQMVRRDYIIDALEYNLAGMPEWLDGKDIPWQSSRQRRNLHSMPHKTFNSRYPCVSFKTGDGVREGTRTIKGSQVDKLDIWGKIGDLKAEYAIS